MGPIMVGIGIYFLVRGQIGLGLWVLSLGLSVVGVIIWALFQPGGWWRPNPSDRDYWDDPERWDQDTGST